MSHHGWHLVSMVCMCLVSCGCGNGLAQVSGIVTVDGDPLRGGEGIRATVYFQPTSGSGVPAVGLVDENGRYELSSGSQSGVQPGDYLVTCSAAQIIPPPDEYGTPGGKRITDVKYASTKTSGLRFTVQPGSNEYNIELKSPR